MFPQEKTETSLIWGTTRNNWKQNVKLKLNNKWILYSTMKNNQIILKKTKAHKKIAKIQAKILQLIQNIKYKKLKTKH